MLRRTGRSHCSRRPRSASQKPAGRAVLLMHGADRGHELGARALDRSAVHRICANQLIFDLSTAVKELLENAVDAGANDIKLIIKDAGKSLVQVIDNGKGMSVTDARLCFERHATSKIRQAEDLFSLHTKGFRGEALASIAAIAHVEMKTRQDH